MLHRGQGRRSKSFLTLRPNLPCLFPPAVLPAKERVFEFSTPLRNPLRYLKREFYLVLRTVRTGMAS